jgi:hypothetical protein
MKSRALKSVLALSCGLMAVSAYAATGAAERPFADADHVVYSPARGVSHLPTKANITNHGGGVLAAAKLVYIFWGPTFANAASPDFAYAATLQAFRNQFGTTPEYKTITQYGALQTNLGAGTADMFDTTTPPTNVTDAIVQSEVNKYLTTHAYDASSIYEVVIPKASYSSSGRSFSCGGRKVSYCAYHGSYSGSFGTTLYSIQPYASCSGCQVAGWSDVQNEEHFVCHETREAATDPVNGWWDGTTGAEADDKCAWSPAPFFGTGGYGYQWEWSNADGACVKTK